MDKVKKIIFFRIPLSICNFRCHYCYLAQREDCYQGVQPIMKYTPEQVGCACSIERLGGPAYFNFCADGETLLLKNIEQYVKVLVEQGHYVEIITNMTIQKKIFQILELPRNLLSHIEFKCSFHYLELKEKGLLEQFAENVNLAWNKGASITVEITPSDELIPYLEEVKEFSIKNFGALPHITIARNDATNGIEYLTKLKDEEYEKVWSQFDSSFWQFKRSIFGKKQTDFCYAGLWSAYVDLSSGEATQCYCGKSLGNVFEDPTKPFPAIPVGKCNIAHCYNGHAFLTWGLIPGANNTYYSDVRDRVRTDGSHWLQPELKQFFHSKLEECNSLLNEEEKATAIRKTNVVYAKQKFKAKIKRIINGKNK